MAEQPRWQIRENASVPVLVALALRHLLGVQYPDGLPPLRDLPEGTDAAASTPVEAQWRAYWDMTVEPRMHPAGVPLELIDGFETIVALPTQGAEALRAAITGHETAALEFARGAHANYSGSIRGGSGSAYRAYAGAIAEFERESGRRAHSFELNVEVLPLSQDGIWWVGATTVAVSDRLRDDTVAFNAAIRPIIAEVA